MPYFYENIILFLATILWIQLSLNSLIINYHMNPLSIKQILHFSGLLLPNHNIFSFYENHLAFFLYRLCHLPYIRQSHQKKEIELQLIQKKEKELVFGDQAKGVKTKVLPQELLVNLYTGF